MSHFWTVAICRSNYGGDFLAGGGCWDPPLQQQSGSITPGKHLEDYTANDAILGLVNWKLTVPKSSSTKN